MKLYEKKERKKERKKEDFQRKNRFEKGWKKKV